MKSLISSTVGCVLALLLMVAGLCSSSAATYSLTGEFSVSSNPNGVWSYGHTPTVGGVFTPMAAARTNEVPSIPIWSWSVNGSSSPDVHYNASASNTFYAGGTSFGPKTLWVTPGHETSTNAYAVMRFTAPTAGTYRVTTTAASYLGANSADSEYRVLENSVELFGVFMPAGNQSTSYSNEVNLAAGGTVDFVVGRGQDGMLFNTGLKINAVLELLAIETNEPPQLAPTYSLTRDFSIAANPNGVWSYGYQPMIGGAFTPMAVARTNEAPGIPIWSWSVTGYESPDVHYNASSTNTFYADGGVFPPRSLWAAPGHETSANVFSVMRFTAPTSGIYHVAASAESFLGQYTADTEYRVVRNGSELFGVYLPAGAQRTGFTNEVLLPQGATLDFVVGRGQDGILHASALKLEADLTVVSVITNDRVFVIAEYNLANDFSVTSNPNGVWSYGHTPTVGGVFTAMAAARTNEVPSIPIWSWSVNGSSSPDVHYNASASNTFYAGGTSFGPKTLWVTPGHETSTNAYAVMRFTAPTAGTYRVTTTAASYLGANSADSEYRVLENSVELFGVFMPAGNQSTSYSNEVNLAAGGTVDFVVGRGQDGMMLNTGLKINAVLELLAIATNEPPQLVPTYSLTRDFSVAANPNGVWSYGYQPMIGGAFTPMAVARTNEAPGIPIWSWSVTGYESPDVHYNASSTNTFHADGGVFPPRSLWAAPGHETSANVFSVMRFTAPTSGLYHVAASAESFLGQYTADTEYRVVRNGTELFGVYLPAGAQRTGFTNEVLLQQGATLDFVVGRGQDGILHASALKLEADLTLLVVTNPPAVATSFDAGRDFDGATNPAGVWAYGWKNAVGATFTPVTSRITATCDNNVPVTGWILNPPAQPAIYCNTSSSTGIIGGGQAILPPGTVWIHPGMNGRQENLGVVRFTAPSNGNYEVTAAFSPLYSGSLAGDTDFHFAHNDVELQGGYLSVTQCVTFTEVLALAQGDTIDFAVGRGADEDEYGSALRVAAVVTPTTNAPTVTPQVPEPILTFNLVNDFSVASNPNGVWSYGHTPTVGGVFTAMAAARTNEVPSIPIWSWSVNGSSSPDVHYNASGSNTFYAGGTSFGPKTLWVTPGHETSTNAYAVMRFTAPTAGTYRVTTTAASYLGANSADSEYRVLENSVELFGVFMPAGNRSTSYSNEVSLAAGGTVDFVVGRGQDGTMFNTGLRINAVLELLAIATNEPPQSAPTYSLTRDFSATNNPNGVWSYGWQQNVGGAFSTLSHTRRGLDANGVPLDIWEFGSGGTPPVFMHFPWTNTQTAVSDAGHGQYPPGTLVYYAGHNGTPQNFAVARFTAPSNSNYEVKAAVRSHLDGMTTGDTDFHVAHNTTEVFGRFLPANSSGGFTGVVALAAGDVLDFAVGRGADNNLSHSGLKIEALITPTTVPTTVTNLPPGTNNPPHTYGDFEIARDFSATNNPNGVWSYGWQQNIGGAFSTLSHTRRGLDANGVPLDIWEFGSGGTPPVFMHFPWTNTQTAVSDGGHGQYPPGTLVYYAGNNGTPQNFVVARFTAPSNSNYSIDVAVRSHLDGVTFGDTDFHVVQNSSELYGIFLPAGGAIAYTNIITLAAGDTLDFALGRGADNNLYGSGLKIQALVAPTTNAPVVLTNPPVGIVSVFDVNEDFNTNSNPHGVWSYGWQSSIGGSFSLVTNARPTSAENGVPARLWEFGYHASPVFMHFPVDGTGSGGGHGTGDWPPGTLLLDPGADGTVQNFAVVRFTAPDTGTYQVRSRVAPAYDGNPQGDTDFHVSVNGIEVFGRFLTPTGQTGYSNAWALAAGDTVDFAVGRGADNNEYGSILKLYATVELTDAPTNDLPRLSPVITLQPSSVAAVQGNNVSMGVTASGTPPLYYQWFRNGAPLSGAVLPTLTLASVQPSQAGSYSVIVSNLYGVAISSNVTLSVTSVISAPLIVSVSSNQTVTIGAPVTFSVAASGTAPLRYQWRFGAQNIPGATNATFRIPTANTNHAGVYSVRVTNNGGSAVSPDIQLTVESSSLERVLAVVSPDAAASGEVVAVPLVLESDGSVGGLSFVLHYNADVLSAPEVTWSTNLDSALKEVNVPVLGQLRGVLALSGTAIPAGTQLVATVNFRARTVASNASVALDLEFLDVSSPAGAPLVVGNATRSGSVSVTGGLGLIGDANNNGRLDVGDGTLLLRLLAQLDTLRPWDVSLSDLNGNAALDSGDVIKVLRTAAGLDPQPAMASAKSASKSAGASSLERGMLDPLAIRSTNGTLVTVQVRLQGINTSISGAAFTLAYPTNALRLLGVSSHRAGPLVPASAIVMWNVAPNSGDYSVQSGQVSFVASSASAWSSRDGVLAELTFEVQRGATNELAWPLTLSSMEVTGLGYNRPILPGAAVFISRDPKPGLLTGFEKLSNGEFKFRLSGDTQATYLIEGSTDLQTWVPIQTIENAGEILQFTDPEASTLPKRFYRARPVTQ